MTDGGMTEAERQEELRLEIERTRRELGETVEALSHKADVKAQVKERSDHAKEQIRERKEHVQTQVREKAGAAPIPVPVAVVGIAAGLLALWLIRRR
jgi:Protein of unknown function (DUF3618)